jgi:hypothetical protein
MALQLLFTIGMHDAFLREGTTTQPGRFDALSMIAFVVGIIAAAAARMVQDFRTDMTNWELFYRCFLGFFGLLAPTYVLVIALPFRRFTGILSTQRIAIASLAVLAAAPFYWQGFIARDYNQLLIGVGIVLAAGIVSHIMPGRREPLVPSDAPSDPTQDAAPTPQPAHANR